MPYRFTPHALSRIEERGIPMEWAEEVLARPQKLIAAREGREERQGLFSQAGKPRLLRLIVEGDKVITAILTTKLDKYGV